MTPVDHPRVLGIGQGVSGVPDTGHDDAAPGLATGVDLQGRQGFVVMDRASRRDGRA